MMHLRQQNCKRNKKKLMHFWQKKCKRKTTKNIQSKKKKIRSKKKKMQNSRIMCVINIPKMTLIYQTKNLVMY